MPADDSASPGRRCRVRPAGYFSHRFKKTMGISPHAFVTQRKILKAEQLLSETSCTLEEVAGQVGYSNLGHFRKQFRKSLGYTPGNLRHRPPLHRAGPEAAVKATRADPRGER